MWKLITALLITAASSATQDDPNDFVSSLQTLVDTVMGNSTLSAEFDSHFSTWRSMQTDPALPKFTCDTQYTRKMQKATSVHKLTPADIDVVAALGDSITAGIGAKARTPLGIIMEWRGLSWSIGGDGDLDQNIITLPNIIKKYNPSVKGFSTGVIPVYTMDILSDKTKFNVAKSGAKSKDIMLEAQKLVARLAADPSVDIKNDWKLVTLFIGGNDLCAYCKDEDMYSFANYSSNLRATLDYLQENLPRTFVNLVMMLDISQLSRVNNGFVCNIIHRLVCNCASFPKSDDAKEALVDQAVEYSESILDLLKSSTYDTRDDFTVVAQPFFVNQRLPTAQGKPDLSYFGPDCFHFSAKGHASSAQALWNNMVEPAGRKRLSWFKDESWNCPSEEAPFFFTYKNSFSVPSEKQAFQTQKCSEAAEPKKSEWRDWFRGAGLSHHHTTQSSGKPQRAHKPKNVERANQEVSSTTISTMTLTLMLLAAFCLGLAGAALVAAIIRRRQALTLPKKMPLSVRAS